MIVRPLLVFFLGVEPGDEYVIEEPVEYANEDQAFDNSEYIAGKMAITLDITSIFALLVVCSIAMSRYVPLVYHASHIAMPSL